MISPVALRRELHRHPELSFEEHQTAATIQKALTEAGIAWEAIAGTGILARIEGRGDKRRAVVLRADIDALPIEEANTLPWRSEHEGVMHACGHDLHAAILYGVLCELREGDFEGTLFGLFQPGEECNPGGAKRVLEAEPWRDYEVVAVVGEHVEPDLEVGTIGLKAGRYMAANDELHLTLEGQGGHGALRDRVQDTISAAARLILKLTALNGPERILSIGRVEGLGATNVIPDRVQLQGTMRLYDEAEREALKHEIKALCADFEQQEQMHCSLEIREGYPAVVNDPGLCELAEQLLPQLGFQVEKLALRPTSEDFGWYGTRYPALFYRLGVGPDAGRIHTASFNPDERAIEVGIRAMRALAIQLLSNE